MMPILKQSNYLLPNNYFSPCFQSGCMTKDIKIGSADPEIPFLCVVKTDIEAFICQQLFDVN